MGHVIYNLFSISLFLNLTPSLHLSARTAANFFFINTVSALRT